jgi:replicative DNA helicase
MNPTAPLIGNIEAEQALLGALMIHNGLADSIADTLTADDFVEPLHGRIFAALVSLIAAGRAATPVTLRPFFDADPAIVDVGGVSYLASLTQQSGGFLIAPELAAEIETSAKRRRTIAALREALTIAENSPETPLSEVAASADVALSEALTGTTITKPGIGIGKLFTRALGAIEAEARGEVPKGIQSALLPDMHEIADLLPGTVTVLAGRPAMGKTAVSLSVSIGAAMNGHGVAYFSLEMKADSLAKRMISDLVFDYGNCPSFNDIKAGKFTAEDYRRIRAAEDKVADWPFEIIDQRGVKIGRIAMMIRRLKRQFEGRGHSLDLVVIDYLQLVKPDRARSSRYEEVGEISRTLKEIAGELGIAILLLAQVNRECEKREDKRPFPHDLRDAGDIEQDADTIVFIYRDEVYLKAAEPARDKPGYEGWLTKLEAARDKIEIYAPKRRDGETMRRHCQFFASSQAVRGSRFFEDRRR